jgi:hypothetical protein
MFEPEDLAEVFADGPLSNADGFEPVAAGFFQMAAQFRSRFLSNVPAKVATGDFLRIDERQPAVPNINEQSSGGRNNVDLSNHDSPTLH